MILDSKLSETAENWAKQLAAGKPFGHSNTAGLGENIYSCSGCGNCDDGKGITKVWYFFVSLILEIHVEILPLCFRLYDLNYLGIMKSRITILKMESQKMEKLLAISLKLFGKEPLTLVSARQLPMDNAGLLQIIHHQETTQLLKHIKITSKSPCNQLITF